jgi:hypothetical protein
MARVLAGSNGKTLPLSSFSQALDRDASLNAVTKTALFKRMYQLHKREGACWYHTFQPPGRSTRTPSPQPQRQPSLKTLKPPLPRQDLPSTLLKQQRQDSARDALDTLRGRSEDRPLLGGDSLGSTRNRLEFRPTCSRLDDIVSVKAQQLMEIDQLLTDIELSAQKRTVPF